MPLTAGTRLGPYEILAPIGAGGMGEVYRAKDTKLDREVAIKVLPTSMAQDRERLARFEREAKVLASLNHPNIAQIYGLIEERLEGNGDTRALVMELVHGETLAESMKNVASAPRPERIVRPGGLTYPLETALNYAKQIAEALEAAHEKGITHRDLKPANIMITPEGVVKVLDFGLASVGQPATSDTSDKQSENSPTLTMAATQAGMIMGTAAYMSPEQAAGKPVDKRSDIWSFGVVLWEMLTGAKLFDGETISHTLADVLRAPIDFSQVKAPGPIVELVKRCLDRDPRKRLRDIGEARLVIEKYLADPSSSGPQAGGSAHPAWGPDLPKRSKWPWAVAAVLAMIAVGASFIAYRATRPAPPKPLVRLDVDLGTDVSLDSPWGSDAILSPDGMRLVYVSKGSLFTRKLDQVKGTELHHKEADDVINQPFFSPDGQKVAFFTQNKLMSISVEGGAPTVLCDTSNSRGGSWGNDGKIIAALSDLSGLRVVPENGGAPVLLTELSQGEVTHRWPQVLRGGKAVLFTANSASLSGFDSADIEVVTLEDKSRKTLVRGGTYARYLPSGHLVYVSHGTLFAVPFDAERLEVQGSPIPMLEQVAYSSAMGFAHYAFAETRTNGGTFIYRSGEALLPELRTIQWLDETGKKQALLNKPELYGSFRISPDGQRLAYSLNGDVWIYGWQRDTMTRLSFNGGTAPIWSPDGGTIVFLKPGDGLYGIRSDGAGKAQDLTKSKNVQVPYSFSPDGKRLAFHEVSANGGDLWTVALMSNESGLRAGKPEPLLQTRFDERQPAFSPDGHWLAYTSNESGTYQVYIRTFPDNGGKWQISDSGGGTYPIWSRYSQELFFRSYDSRTLFVSKYTLRGESFLAGKPRIWSTTPLANLGLNQNYDLALDGRRVIALMPVETQQAQQAQNHVIFLENFFDELRRKVPLGK